MGRKKVPEKTQADILFANRRRCPLCFSYYFDSSFKKGQIVHLDKNPNNNSPENLLYLCLEHHDEYDSQTSQSKGITKEEILKCNIELQEFLIKSKIQLDEPFNNTGEDKLNSIVPNTNEKVESISIELYKLRLPIYYSYRKFISKILQEATFELNDLYEFLDGIHEAVFLFGDEVNDCLSEIKTKAIQFRTAQKTLTSKSRLSEKQRNKFEEVETKLFVWLAENFDKVNSVFEKHMRINN